MKKALANCTTPELLWGWNQLNWISSHILSYYLIKSKFMFSFLFWSILSLSLRHSFHQELLWCQHLSLCPAQDSLSCIWCWNNLCNMSHMSVLPSVSLCPFVFVNKMFKSFNILKFTDAMCCLMFKTEILRLRERLIALQLDTIALCEKSQRAWSHEILESQSVSHVAQHPWDYRITLAIPDSISSPLGKSQQAQPQLCCLWSATANPWPDRWMMCCAPSLHRADFMH